jgi:hypothetical protein
VGRRLRYIMRDSVGKAQGVASLNFTAETPEPSTLGLVALVLVLGLGRKAVRRLKFE